MAETWRRVVCNPAKDAAFVLVVRQALHGARDAADLEREVRRAYPRAVVHRTELAGSVVETWYAYRDGHWAGDRTGVIDVDEVGPTQVRMAEHRAEAPADEPTAVGRPGDPPRSYLELRLDEARDRLAAAPPRSVLWFDALSAVRQLELLLAGDERLEAVPARAGSG